MGASWFSVLVDWLDSLGAITRFCANVVGRVLTLRVFRFFGEALRQTGILILGSAIVIWGMCFILGLTCGIEGAYLSRGFGASSLTGAFAAWCDLREVIPYAFGYMMSAKVGTGLVAEIGAMRISEEIDALEVMGVPSLPYLITTRMIAGFIAIIPLYVIALLSSYLASRLLVTVFYGQSPGTYDHYFNLFLPPVDILYSFGKVLVFAVAVILIHCFYGYRASGGPAGVGVAVGRAVRTSIVVFNVLDVFLTLAIWGTTTTVRIAG